MSEREVIVEYLRNWSTSLISCAISDYKQSDEWRRLNAAARAVDGIAQHIENGDHYGEEYLEEGS